MSRVGSKARRVLVVEWVCAGACDDEVIAGQLFPKGRAMLCAVGEDVAQLPDTNVRTLSAFGPMPFGETVETTSSTWRERYDREVATADRVLVIAPEFPGGLDVMLGGSSPFANCSQDAVRWAGDKLAVYNTLSSHLSTPETRLAGDGIFPGGILKPRYGVASGVWRDTARIEDDTIAQPFIEGTPMSVAAIFDHGRLVAALPPCRQQIEEDEEGVLYYAGGEITIPDMLVPRPDFAAKVAEYVDGLHGYVGFDYIDTPDGPVLIEVNPRVSVSYIGYRAATEDNLAAWLLGDRDDAVTWPTGTWSWDEHGHVTTK